MNNIIEKANKLCKDNDAKLLYLVKFGSHLYGTNTKDSDTDYKGLFLPSNDSLILDINSKLITQNTSVNNCKNTSDDIDFQLWDIRYWLLNLLQKGDTNAIDLLFSKSNIECVVYCDDLMNDIFNNPLKCFSPKKATAYTGYVIGQAKKYGVKGSRLGVLKRIYEYLEKVSYNEYQKLDFVSSSILERYYDESYCFSKEVNGEMALVICGSVHLLSIKLEEFHRRIENQYKKYGERAKKAEQNQGIDWKAISHAYRCLFQMEELFETKNISFPLTNCEKLTKIKLGEYDWKQCEQEICLGLEKVDKLKEDCDWNYFDKDFVNNSILRMYGEG